MDHSIIKIKDVNCFLIKTNNGKYYHDYLDNGYIGIYSGKISIKNKERDYFTFTNDLNIGDYVLITSHKNKMISIGRITSPPQVEDNHPIRMVTWLKTIEIKDLFSLYRYLKQNKLIIKINDFIDDILRITHPIFYKDDKYHLVITITNQAGIPFKSLCGFYDILLSEVGDQQVEVKTVLKSPGIIELITEKLEVIILIIKLVKLIVSLANKAKDKSNEKLIQKYYANQVDRLQIEIPDFTDFDNFNS